MASNEQRTAGHTNDLNPDDTNIMKNVFSKLVIAEEEFSTGVDDRQYQGSIFTKMGKLFQHEQLSDVMLMAEGQSIPCHKMLLASVSEYFHRKFVTEANSMENNLLEIEGIPFRTLNLIVSYLYSGKINTNVENIKELITASDMLKLTSLSETCGHYAVKILDATNCIGFYRIATSYSVKHLIEMAHQVMLNKFLDVVTGPEFKAMAEDEVIKYIQDEKLRILNEDPVFDAAVTWVKHDIETRRPCFPILLKHVRLAHCTPSHLQNVVARQQLMEHPECQKKLTLSFVQKFADEDRMRCIQDTEEFISEPRAYYNTLLFIGKRHLNDPIECYFVANREWVHMKDLASSQFANAKDYSACVTKDGVLVSGGFRQGALSDCWLLSNTEFKWATIPNLNTARYGHVSVAIGDHVFVVGGKGGNNSLLSPMEHLDTDWKKWEAAPALSTPLEDPMVACIDQYMYVFGHDVCVRGAYYAGMQKVSKYPRSFAFDTVSRKWIKIADMPQQCSKGSAVALLNKIYVVGGAERCCMSFDPYLREWTILSQCSYQHNISVVWKGRILVCGGQERTAQRHMKEIYIRNIYTAEEYDPSTDTWRVSDLKLPDTARAGFIFAIEKEAKT